MKIAVFGDSYANSIKVAQASKYNNAVSWADLLAEKYEVTNFGVPGSSTYYSFKEFKKHQQGFDKIIFLPSTPGRLFLSNKMKLESNLPDIMKQHFNSIDAAEFMLAQLEMINGSLIDKKRTTAVRDYFLWIMNIEEVIDYQNLMIKEIKQCRPDVLLQETSTKSGSDLWTIASMEIDHWGETQDSINQQNLFEIRCNHLTKENNIILANKIEQWIQHGTPVTISESEFVKPSEPIGNYFIKEKVN